MELKEKHTKLSDTMAFDYDQFFHKANSAFMVSEQQRYGQFLMNYLSEFHPEITVPDEFDCFYDNNKIPQFLGYIASL